VAQDNVVTMFSCAGRHYSLEQHTHGDARCVSLALTELEGGKIESELHDDLRKLTMRICDLVMGQVRARV